MSKLTKLAALLFAGAGVGAVAYYKWNFRMPWKEYAQYALQMAMLDDKIGCDELEICQIEGRSTATPTKEESMQERYRHFLQSNRGKSRRMIQSELAGMERRRQSSRECLHRLHSPKK